MQYSGLQLAAVMKAAQLMAIADGHVDQKETMQLVKEISSFGVTPDNIDPILAKSSTMEPPEMVSILSGMTESQKKYVSGFLASVMLSDGEIDKEELKLWILTNAMLGFPKMGLEEALNYWGNN